MIAAVALRASTAEPVSRSSDVISTPFNPHGSINEKQPRSTLMFRLIPWNVTHRLVPVPIDAIFRRPTHTPVMPGILLPVTP
jgi:hypothetical protein